VQRPTLRLLGVRPGNATVLLDGSATGRPGPSLCFVMEWRSPSWSDW